MTTVSVRYIVEDLAAAIGFYGEQLGFEVDMHPAPTFAMLSRGDLRLLLSVPSEQGGGGQSMPVDGASNRGAGTASSWRSPTWMPRWSASRRLARTSATTSSGAWVVTRSWSRTRRGMWSSCSSPDAEPPAPVAGVSDAPPRRVGASDPEPVASGLAQGRPTDV
jgi:hypothetical protein